MPGSLQDEVSFAKGTDYRVSVWAFLRHTPDCQLKTNQAGRRTAEFKLVVQNTSTDSVRILLSEAILVLKTGAVLRPFQTEVRGLERGKSQFVEALRIERDSKGMTFLPLDILEATALTLKFLVDDVVFEPELLERCEFFHLPVLLSQNVPRFVLVQCDFKERLIWDHYQYHFGRYWVFLP